MPNQTVRDEYARWLATPPIGGMLVETMEISGPGMNSGPLRLANRTDRALTATDELGLTSIWHPLAFTLSKPSLRNSSELLISARVDGVDGMLHEIIAKMTADQLRHPLYVTLRIFIDPIMLDRPVYRAPIRLRCETAKVGIDVIDMTLVGGRLPNKQAGTVYSLERFVGTRPF